MSCMYKHRSGLKKCTPDTMIMVCAHRSNILNHWMLFASVINLEECDWVVLERYIYVSSFLNSNLYMYFSMSVLQYMRKLILSIFRSLLRIWIKGFIFAEERYTNYTFNELIIYCYLIRRTIVKNTT